MSKKRVLDEPSIGVADAMDESAADAIERIDHDFPLTDEVPLGETPTESSNGKVASLPVLEAFRQQVIESPDAVWPLNPGEIIVDPKRNGRAFEAKPQDKDIKEMAESIKTMGQLVPGEVEIDAENRMYLVFGYRRFCAINLINSTRASADALPFKAFVRIDVSPTDSRTRNLAENDRRKDLTVLDRAKVISDFVADGLNQKQIAECTGWSRATVNNYVKINTFPDSIKTLIAAGKLPARAAIELCAIDPEKLEESAAKLIEAAGPSGSITVTNKGEVQVNPTGKRKKKAAAGGKSDTLTMAAFVDCIDWLLEAKQKAQLHKSIEEVLRVVGDLAFGRAKREAALKRLSLYK